MVTFAQDKPATWTPDTDWGHWRLGQKADLEFLKTNNMTITFGSGAPSFEDVSREEFNRGMEQAKTTNRALHDKGYIVLRYLTSSIHGRSASNKDEPQKDQIRMLQFWREGWNDYEDYLGQSRQKTRRHGSRFGRTALSLTIAMPHTARKPPTSSKPGDVPTIRTSLV